MGGGRLAALLVLVLVGTLLHPGLPATAEVPPPPSREWTTAYLFSGGPSVRRAAEAALLGSEEDLRLFRDELREQAQQVDDRAAAQVLAGMDGPAMRAAALQALAGNPQEVRVFVSGGWEVAWASDERVRAYRLVESGGPTMRRAAEQALAGTPEQLRDFLAEGRHAAQVADDRLAVTRMLTGGSNNSGPVLDAAAQEALVGSAEQLREFLDSGQFVARARDQELASIRSLTEQAKQASETTARESLAATEASIRAANAADEAKKAAETAAAETAAAGGAARNASAAAARAADAAGDAAHAARDAVAASNASMRAARVAADAARKATTAASLTAQAASRAQRAAADARTDAGKAAAARLAAQQARDAAAKARELDQVKAQRDRALAQAKAAATAAKNASADANAAARAADEAAGHAGVSEKEAQRARDAAARAEREAAAAARAADRAYALAERAARESDKAFAYAAQAAQHAEAAATAAEAAAAAAGEAGKAAEESAKHAAAAATAANIAVEAANQAVELEALARQEDQGRRDEAKAQGVQAAQDALADEQAQQADAGAIATWNRKLLWDTAEEDRVDPATRLLLNEATAPGVPTEVVLDGGRRAALALITTGGDWTRAAAEEALSGGEVELRSWLTSGRQFSVGQDDRARVWHLIDTLPDGNEKSAARTALAGDDAAVQQFLRTRSHVGKYAKDRQAIYKILETAGPALRAAAEAALAGTPMDAHNFLRSGQYPARTADERREIYAVMDAGGPEVDAAGDVALAGPASYVSYFLTAGRYEAAKRDMEQAAHVAAVQALIQEAQQYAQSALAEAAEAKRVAAVAAGQAADAARYAQDAINNANNAQTYANQAAQSALAAKASADQAAQSAAIARNAANSAQASADAAAQSATTASAAARRARADSEAAYQASWDARQAAQAAGQDALAADLAAKEAARIYTTRLKEYEQQRRSVEPGSGSDGVGTAADEHKTWGCLVPKPSLAKDCLKVYGDFALAVKNPVMCDVPANMDRADCLMLGDLNTFVDENPEMVLDMLQFVLMACGLAPGAGEVCDGVDAAVSFARGDWVGGLLGLGAMVPVLGYGATSVKGGRAADKLRDINKVIEALSKCNSFAPGTRVLLANGKTKRIEDVKKDDLVLATDPRSGRTAAKPVNGTIYGIGEKRLVDLTFDLDGAGDGDGMLTATTNHPFWAPDSNAWVDAGSLTPGQWVHTSSGIRVKVAAIAARTASAEVYNLSVADFQTFYVVVGDTSVLVHNSGICGNRVVAQGDWQHVLDRHRHGGKLVDDEAGLFVGKEKLVRQRVVDTINRGTPRNNTNDPITNEPRPGKIFEWDFGQKVGESGKANGRTELTKVCVVVNEDKLVTAYPC
ncbi:polymorphic toxin-type HINT domain-containing protein [Micromonospora sp. HNM0581]|uniref:polymorphic toxin-type HINT domain-containing protein n=1 Tax=Micromonospora sp. HNM0581 TaxID=2716341 RepID=UPI0032170C58